MIRHDAALILAATAIDFDLAPTERTELDAHLAACPTCPRTVRALHADAAHIAGLPEPVLASSRADAIAARVLVPPRSAQVRPLRLVLVTALIALLALGSFLVGSELLRRAEERDDLSVVPPVPTASVAPVASPSPSPVWAKVEIGGMPNPLTGVAGGDQGLLAFGSAFGCAEPCMLPVVASVTGDSWSTVPEQAALASEPYVPTSGPMLGIVDAAWGPIGWVAVGYLKDDTPGNVTVWHSPDGRTWERLPDLTGFQQVDPKAVVGWAEGYLIVGTDLRETTDGVRIGHAYAAAWTSSDGRTWMRAPDDPVLDVGGFSDTTEWPDYGGMTAVSRLTDGTFLAVGTAHGACREMFDGVVTSCDDQPLAWRSSDGLRWTRTPALPVVDGGATDVTAVDDGRAIILVRTQRSVGESVVVETSLVRWSEGTGWDVTAGPADPAEKIAVVDGRVLVTGADGSSALPPVWGQGNDGNWSRVALPGWQAAGYVQGAGLAVGPGGAVLVGTLATDGGGWQPFAYVFR